MRKALYLIPDTNVLLQCRSFHELDWSSLLDRVTEITLVLVTPVVRETDRQKGGQGRLANRARKVNSWIGDLLDQEALEIRPASPGPAVRLISADAFKPDPELGDQLDYSHPDDSIVGTVSAFRKAHSGEEVALLSRDNAVLLAAKRVGVPFYKVPEDWLLPAETNEDQKRIKALESELARVMKAEPNCLVEAVDGPWKFETPCYEPLQEEQIGSLLEVLRSKFPCETDFGPKEMPARAPTLGLAVANLREEFRPASQETIEHYRNVTYPEWLKKCEEVWRTLHSELNSREAAPRIEFTLRNDGSRPAEDVSVDIALKGKGWMLSLVDADEEEKTVDLSSGATLRVGSGQRGVRLPPVPKAPKGDWIKRSLFPHHAATMASVEATRLLRDLEPISARIGPPPQRETDTFYWKPGTRPTHPRPSTSLTCSQFRHQSRPEEFEFNVVMLGERAPGQVKGALSVEVHAANLGTPVVVTFPIEVTMALADTYGEAEALLELLQPRGLGAAT